MKNLYYSKKRQQGMEDIRPFEIHPFNEDFMDEGPMINETLNPNGEELPFIPASGEVMAMDERSGLLLPASGESIAMNEGSELLIPDNDVMNFHNEEFNPTNNLSQYGGNNPYIVNVLDLAFTGKYPSFSAWTRPIQNKWRGSIEFSILLRWYKNTGYRHRVIAIFDIWDNINAPFDTVYKDQRYVSGQQYGPWEIFGHMDLRNPKRYTLSFPSIDFRRHDVINTKSIYFKIRWYFYYWRTSKKSYTTVKTAQYSGKINLTE